MLLFGSGLLVYAPHRNTSSIRNVEIKCFHGLVCCDLTALFTLKNQLILVFKKKKKKKEWQQSKSHLIGFCRVLPDWGGHCWMTSSCPYAHHFDESCHSNGSPESVSVPRPTRGGKKKRKKCNVMMSEEVLYNMRPLSVTSCLLDAH